MSSTTALVDHAALEAAAGSITPLPAATARLLAVAGRPDVSVAAIVDIVRYDPGLTAALLRQSNSAFSMSVRKITDVRDAVVRLGLDTVVSVAMRVAVGGSMQGTLELYDLDGGRLYRHAVLAAVGAEVARGRFPTLVPSITPTVALLHDIGKLVLSKAVGTRATELVSVLSDREDRPLHAVETEVFGLHHGQAGRFVIQQWKLPTSFLEGIVGHHGDVGEPSVFARAVQLADVLAHTAEGLRATAPDLREEEVAAVQRTFELGDRDLTDLAEVTLARFDAIAEAFAG